MSVTSVSRDIRPESDPYRSEDDHLLSSSLHRIDHSRSSTEKEIEEIISVFLYLSLCIRHSDDGKNPVFWYSGSFISLRMTEI